MSAIEVEGAVLKINGVEVKDVKVVSFKPTPVARKDELPLAAKYEGSFDITFSGEDAQRLWEALDALWKPEARYWQSRRAFHVKRWRRRVARHLGVSYREFRRFCRTGRWS